MSILDFGFWILDFGGAQGGGQFRVLHVDFGFWILDFGGAQGGGQFTVLQRLKLVYGDGQTGEFGQQWPIGWFK